MALLLRLAASASLIGLLLTVVDLRLIVDHWASANWPLIIVVTPIIQLGCLFLRAIRQRLILRRLGVEAFLGWLVCIQSRANFLRTFFPGGVGGDVYKAWSLAKGTDARTQSIASVLVERLFGVGSMLLLSLGSLLYARRWLEDGAFQQLSWPIMAASFGFLTMNVVLWLVGRSTGGSLTRLNTWWPLAIGRDIGRQISLFLGGAELFKMAALSIVLQIAIVIWYFTISTGMGLGVSIQTYLIVIPLVEILMMLPISIGGIGVREVALVVLLAPFGVTAASAVALSVASLAVATAVNVLSGAAFLVKIESRSVGIGERFSARTIDRLEKEISKPVRSKRQNVVGRGSRIV